MIKILFICHGNICRSPMAEFVFKNMVRQKNLQDLFLIESAATSSEAIGCDIHRGTKKILTEKNVPFSRRAARKITPSDYDKYDYLIGMDERNIWNMQRIFINDKDKKIYSLLDFTSQPRDIADPWYTDNFEQTYEDIVEGCNCLLNHILNNF